MKRRELNKEIKKINKRYYDACDTINYKHHNKIIEQMDTFRKNCIIEIFRLKNKDKELIKLRKLREAKK